MYLFVCAGMFTISEEAEGAAPLSTPPAATGKTETAEEDGEEASSLGQDMQTALNVVDAVSPDFSDLSPLGQLLRLCGQEVRFLYIFFYQNFCSFPFTFFLLCLCLFL